MHLGIRADQDSLTICQTNAIPTAPVHRDSCKLGINSIRRIAQNYAGRVEVRQDGANFAITIVLTDIL